MTTRRKLIAWLVAGVFACGVTATVAVAAGDGKDPVAKPPAAEKIAVKADKPDGGDKKVSDAPPVVVKTVPAAGDEAVDPGLKEIRVTFSKEMMDKSWSWATDTGRGADVTSGGGKPFYDKDKKTNVLPVKLEPETTYAVWINGGKFNSFVDTDKTPSLPYLLVFRTGKAK